MGKVVSIIRGPFLSGYGLFLLGVFATIVVPQVFYCAYGGPVSPWLLVVIAQAGVIAGLVKVIRPATPFASIIDTQTAPVSQGGWTRRRKLS
jgi:hypothetical protein